MQPMNLCSGGYTGIESTMRPSNKITIGVTIHDMTTRRWLSGEGWQQLRRKYLKTCQQNNIYYQNLGRMVGLELKNPYKLHVLVK